MSKVSHATFILIHGSGLGSWIWRETIPLLTASAIAIDLPGREGKVNRYTFEEYLQVIIDAIHTVKTGKVILVGHSIGNEFALAVANKMPEHILAIVSLGGLVPRNGESYYSLTPQPQRTFLKFLSMIYKNGLRPPTSMIIKSYAEDLDIRTKEELLQRYSYESPKIFEAPIAWDKIPSNIARYYIKLLKDKSGLSLKAQDEMAKRMHAEKIFSLNTGHLGMLQRPKELADILNSIVK